MVLRPKIRSRSAQTPFPVPPPFRTEFFELGESIHSLFEVASEVDLSPARLQELIDLGAIYADGKRLKQDGPLPTGSVLRIHFNPKRYTDLQLDIQKHVVFQNEDFVVWDKPAGLPTHPCVDNWIENLQEAGARALGKRLWTTHRLDHATQGLVVMGFNREFAAQFNRELQFGTVIKVYDVLTAAKPPTGLWIHHMVESKGSPKVVLNAPSNITKPCKLLVLSTREFEWTPGIAKKFYLSRVLLLTGRTHQIRAQFAHQGFPLLGDTLYGGYASSQQPTCSLKAQTLMFSFRQCPYAFHLASLSRVEEPLNVDRLERSLKTVLNVAEGNQLKCPTLDNEVLAQIKSMLIWLSTLPKS